MDEHVIGCDDCEREKFDKKEFGLFGLDLKATKRMMNSLLKPHGLRLKVTPRRIDDQSEVQIEPLKGWDTNG